ncbi:hypothetical protein CAPTEDRAFT_201716 [Capitella teleta]|uniref:Secreted protein n=1 Tax=Capitella teleta TaxID=283909 RepID=R7V927_CAPTE|nr:hypothetical protein CAPTEDRAFT_201716 [Capitella teleta]|eukprot:ELU12220.1 hypothetical protein CAPTEDRAFT_201716 [Capitella teleta]
MKETYLILLVIFSTAPEKVLSFTCDQDQTAISSPWLFSTAKTCPDLISGVPDYYNDIYRSECQRQLGLDEKPDSVPRANVEECYNLNNGTFKYRSTVCCPEKRACSEFLIGVKHMKASLMKTITESGIASDVE